MAQKLVPLVLQSQETLDQVLTLSLLHAHRRLTCSPLIECSLSLSHSPPQVAVLMGRVLQEEPVQAGAVSLLQELVKDPEVYQVLIDLVTRVVAEDKVQQAVNAMLIGASHKVRRTTHIHTHRYTQREVQGGLARSWFGTFDCVMWSVLVHPGGAGATCL